MGLFSDHLTLGQVIANRARRGVVTTGRNAKYVVDAGQPARDRMMPAPGQSVQTRSEQHDRADEDGHQSDQESGEALACHRQMKHPRLVETTVQPRAEDAPLGNSRLWLTPFMIKDYH